MQQDCRLPPAPSLDKGLGQSIMFPWSVRKQIAIMGPLLSGRAGRLNYEEAERTR